MTFFQCKYRSKYFFCFFFSTNKKLGLDIHITTAVFCVFLKRLFGLFFFLGVRLSIEWWYAYSKNEILNLHSNASFSLNFLFFTLSLFFSDRRNIKFVYTSKPPKKNAGTLCRFNFLYKFKETRAFYNYKYKACKKAFPFVNVLVLNI